MCLGMCVCVCIFVRVCVRASVPPSMLLRRCLSPRVGAFECLCVRASFVSVSVCMRACMCAWVGVCEGCVWACVCLCVCVHKLDACLHACVCVCATRACAQCRSCLRALTSACNCTRLHAWQLRMCVYAPCMPACLNAYTPECTCVCVCGLCVRLCVPGFVCLVVCLSMNCIALRNTTQCMHIHLVCT